MSIYRKPNILYLKGITLSDFSIDDSIFDKKFTEEIETSVRMINYSSIPQVFTTWDKWPKTSNLRCWHCDRVTGGIPLFIVDELTWVDGNRTIIPKGHFCTENCAQAYIDYTYKGSQHDDKTKYLLMMHRERLHNHIFTIQPAPPKTIMRQYCGVDGITEEEYGRKLAALSADSSARQPPVKPLLPMNSN